MSIKRKIHHLISGQLPEFVRTDHPRFVTFLEEYYKFLEQEGQVHDVLLNNMEWTDIDDTLDVFIPYFRSQFTYDFPADTILNNRKLIKYINQYYEAKGSETATEMFFRFMFNDTAEVKYPGDYLLRASDGRWGRKRFIKVDTTRFSNENIYELKEKIITLYYLEYIAGAGNFTRTVTTRCLDVYETSRPNIYQLQVDINPNYVFPDDISADTSLAASLGNFDTHVYVQYIDGATTTTYGTISKQLTKVVSIDEAGSKFRRDDSYFISETGIEGLYFAGDYTEVTTGNAAYAYEALQNNAIVRVVKTENTLAEQYFLEDYTIFGDYASAPTRGKIKLLSIVDSGEKFLVRKTGVIESVTILDGGTGYAIGATSVNLVGDGSGAEFRVLVSNGKITQVTVLNGGANYSNEVNPITGLPLTTLTASGSGTGAVFELNISTDFTPVKTFTVDFNNGRSGSSTALVTFATGHVYHAPGEYVDNAGFLSDIIKLQDNDYYQPYSYVIETGEQISKWRNNYLDSTHPAGFKMFSNLLLTGELNASEITMEDELNQLTPEDFDYREVNDVVAVTENVAKTINKGNISDAVSITDNLTATIVFLRDLNETVNSTDSISSLNVSKSSNDSITTNDQLNTNVSKTLTDTVITSDAANISTEVHLNDTLTISDALHYEYTQLDDATSDLIENVAISDDVSLQPALIKVDTVGVSDISVLTINKNPSDTIITSDAINTIDTNIHFTDTLNVSDVSIRNFDQQNDATSDLSETLSISDSLIATLTYLRDETDTVALSENVLLTSELLKTDSISTSENLDKNLDKSLTDTQTVVDSGGSAWVDSYFVNGRYSASPYVAGDYVGTAYSL